MLIFVPFITAYPAHELRLMKRVIKARKKIIATRFSVFGYDEQGIAINIMLDLHPHRIFPSMDGSTFLSLAGSQFEPIDRVLEHRRGLGRTVHG